MEKALEQKKYFLIRNFDNKKYFQDLIHYLLLPVIKNRGTQLD